MKDILLFLSTWIILVISPGWDYQCINTIHMSIFVFRHINIHLRSANNHIHLSAKYFSATFFSFFSSLPSFYYFWFVYNVWFIHYSWHKNKMGGTLLLFLSTFSVTLCSFDNHLLSLDFTSSSCSSPSHSNIDRHSFFWENKKLIDKWKLCSVYH